MKSLLFLSGTVLLCMGCSHSRFVPQAPARVGSAEDRPRIDETFRANGDTDSTSAVGSDTKAVTRSAVAAKGRYLLASSKQLKTVPDSLHDEPTIDLHVTSIKEIRAEDRALRRTSFGERLGQVPRWSLQGALGGLDTIGSLFAPRRYLAGDRDLLSADLSHDREFFMAATVVGGVGGAVLYPLARLFCPESRKKWPSHRDNVD